MNRINTLLLTLAKRAEQSDRKHLVESFVDVGPVFALLSNRDSQILFGRRGTGKTHLLEYLSNTVISNGKTAIQLDMRTMGSTGGIYSDPVISLSERATRLLVDCLTAIHEQLLKIVIENSEKLNLSVLGPLLDAFADAATSVTVQGKVELSESGTLSATQTSESSATVGFGANLTATVGTTSGARIHGATETTVRREGTERLRVNFGSVNRELERIVCALPDQQLWIIIDEWSEVPLDIQPYLADLIRRTIMPIRGVSVKIAAIEQRCRFRIEDSSVGHIGIEVGADAAAGINLDEFLVFENDPDRAKQFFKELLVRHARTAAGNLKLGFDYASASEFIRDSFTQVTAFEEFVRAAEGVPRDAINIASIAAQKAVENPISVQHIRAAAQSWYTRNKQQAVTTKPRAQTLLTWIIDEVIKHRQARAFLLAAEVRDEIVDFLYDARVIHLIKQGISTKDEPGRRYNVYGLDYGCYVELITTSRAPKGLFGADSDDQCLCSDVPFTDLRSIRRAVLDLSDFYKRN